MSTRASTDRLSIDPPRPPVFDGFPYLLTRVAPAIYHLILLPAEHDADVLLNLGHRQTQANRCPHASCSKPGVAGSIPAPPTAAIAARRLTFPAARLRDPLPRSRARCR